MIYENNGAKFSTEKDDFRIPYPKNLYAFQKLTLKCF